MQAYFFVKLGLFFSVRAGLLAIAALCGCFWYVVVMLRVCLFCHGITLRFVFFFSCFWLWFGLVLGRWDPETFPWAQQLEEASPIIQVLCHEHSQSACCHCLLRSATHHQSSQPILNRPIRLHGLSQRPVKPQARMPLFPRTHHTSTGNGHPTGDSAT